MEKSSFFNSIAGDRVYQASDFANFFNSFITNGIFPDPSTNLQVMANNDMTVTILAGKAWINGYVYINDSDLILPIDVADGVLKRIDRIAVRFDTTGRLIFAEVIKGSPASSPLAADLQRDADGYELGIADILVSNGVVSISQANITDLRMDTAYCGWVNSLIQADTTSIFNQYQDWFTTQSGTYNDEMIASETQFETDFNTWFNEVKTVLGGDVAANLLVKIDDNTAALVAHSADSVQQTTADITYYVATTGSDTTGDGTSGLPFKTIQFAIDKLPQIINHIITINLITGTYAEVVTISGFVGKGKINLNGGTNLATAPNFIIDSIQIISCYLAAINIKGITANNTVGTSYLLKTSKGLNISFCRSVVSVVNYGFYTENSLVYIHTCEISNKNAVLCATYCSTVAFQTLTGSGNAVGLNALKGSTIAKSGTVPTSTTAETTASGGVIR